MAVNTATTIKYDQRGVREDLANVIYDLDNEATPFMTAIGRGKPAKSTFVEWQIDELAAAAANAALEGDDAAFVTADPSVRLGNYTQIFTKSIVVSGTAQAVDAAGRRNELTYQLDKRSREIKRDMELAFTGNTASEDGSRLTARYLAGFESWITTNDSRGSGSGATQGSAGGWTTSTKVVAAPADASTSNRRTFSEAQCKAVIREIWNETGESIPLILVGSFNKQTASGFSGIATQYTNYGNVKSSAAVSILGAADIYVSDFGRHKIVPNKHQRQRSALFVNPKHWEARYLRPFKVEKIAKTGDADKRQLLAEVTICAKNQKGSGVVADLLES